METKVLSIWEIAHSIIFLDREQYPEDQFLTEAEFFELRDNNPEDWKICDHYFRNSWLVKNGYEVTHANIINADLTIREE